MASLNKVMLIGNLGRDPEVSYTPSGMAVARFSIATAEYWTDKATGERKEKTEWHRIVVFAKLAETCGRYLTKGKQIYVEGSLKTSSYEKDGITRYNTDVVASHIQFLGGNPNAGQGGGQQSTGFRQGNNNRGFQNNQGSQGQGFNQNQGGFDNGFLPPDDDIPF